MSTLLPQKPLHSELFRIFLGSVCPVCGNSKRPRQCFDTTCYFALPQPERNGLYVSALDGDEFFENYQAAIETLRSLGMADRGTKCRCGAPRNHPLHVLDKDRNPIIVGKLGQGHAYEPTPAKNKTAQRVQSGQQKSRERGKR